LQQREKQMALISRRAKLWNGGIVPFVIDQDMIQEQKDAIAGGIKLVTDRCQGVTFVGHGSEQNWLHFIVYADPANLGSESPIGRPFQPGPQFIKLSSNIRAHHSEGTIAHEICHSLGLLHEQNRSDRSGFVSINFSNIATFHHDQFQPRPSDQPSDFGAYDKFSIMHYQRRAYALNPSIDTITPLAAPPALATGTPPSQDFSSTTPSSGDIAAINSLYPPSMPFGETSDTGPALASQGGTLLLAWKGRGNTRLATMTSTSGNVFSGKTTLNDSSTNGPALAVHYSHFVMAWTGESDNKLNIMQSDNGSSWHSKVTLDETSPSTPALAPFGPELYLAWRGGDNRLNLMHSLDGTNWSGKHTINETTDSGPALGWIGSKLLLVWRGRGNNNINIIRAPGGIIASGLGGTHVPGFGKVTLGDTTDDRPAICNTGSHAYLAWQGSGNGFMNVMKSTNGEDWGDKITANTEHIGGGTAIASWNHILVRAWTESASPGNLRSRAFSEF
jgi:hypothetical protein